MDDLEQMVYTEEEVSPTSSEPTSQPEEQMIPKHRFDEIAKQKSSFQRQAEDLQRQLDESKKPGANLTPEQLEEFNNRLMAMPAMKAFNERFQRLDEREKTDTDNFFRQTESKMAEFGKELGVTDQSSLYELQSVVAEKIRQNPQFRARFRNNDASVIDEAYKAASTSGLIASLRRGRKAAVETVKSQGPAPPRNIAKALPPEKKEQAEPLRERDMLKKAHDSAYARLSEHTEGV